MRKVRMQRPFVLRVLAKVYVALLLAAIASIVLRSHAAANIASGLFGVVAACVGVVLASNLQGSAEAMETYSKEFYTGPLPVSGGPMTARKFRALGACLIVFGIGLSVLAWSGAVTWKQ